MSNEKWRDVPTEHLEKWSEIFARSQEILHLTSPCPVCQSAFLCRWFQVGKARSDFQGFIASGGLWEWCRHCRCFQHFSGLVPDWWSCDLEVDSSKMTPYPTAIEEVLNKLEK